MKMLLRVLLFTQLILTIVTPWLNAQAHGTPVIEVQPDVVQAGGEILITGTGMESGEVFAITLDGVISSVLLNEAVATGEGEEAGFETSLTLPMDIAPGTYTIRAETEDGEFALSDLTVTAALQEASSGPATVQEPSGEEHLIDRSKPAGQVVGVVAVALASLGLGFWLVLRRGGHTL